MKIPLRYDRLDHPSYQGGYADVWKGEHGDLLVAVKVPRVYQTDDMAKIKCVS